MVRSELSQRVAVAALGIPLALLHIYLGGWALGLLLALLAAGGAHEVYRLAALRGVRAFVMPGAAAAAALVLLAVALRAPAAAAPGSWALLLLLVLALGTAALWARGADAQPLASVAITLLGALYTGGTLAYGVYLRHLVPDSGPLLLTEAPYLGPPSSAWVGTALVAYALAITWLNDTAAYFAGRAWGRRKLMPRVSPGKTVVGALAGLGAALLTGLLFTWAVLRLWLDLPLGLAAGAVGGLLIGVAAQLGDLVESLFKRDAGVKDSGALFPGHGGILDRLDALFFALPAAHWYLRLTLPLASGGAAWP